MKNPRMEIIQRLQIYDPDFGSSLDSDSNTPLHLALIYSDSDVLVRELAQLNPAALEKQNKEEDTPLHLAVSYSDSVAMVRELAQLHPAALEMQNNEEDTPLHLAARFSSSVEVLRELVALSPAALVTMNGRGETPLAATILSSFDHSPAFDVKLQVLLEAAPQAARIACSNSNDCLPLHLILYQRNPPATMELVAMVLAAYREAVNIPNSDGSLPIHIAARFASFDVIKMIAEENLSNLTVMLPSGLSLVHVAVISYILETLRNQIASAPSNKFYIVYDNGDSNKSVRNLSPPLPVSAASDLLLRFLLRHCPSLVAAQDINGLTSYDRLPAENSRFAYARRLLLLAGASSLYPGVLQEMNYAARREALLLFHFSSSAMGRTIFSLIRNGAGGPELMRTIVCFL
jgi:ankyrin repeat protein